MCVRVCGYLGGWKEKREGRGGKSERENLVVKCISLLTIFKICMTYCDVKCYVVFILPCCS